MNLRHILIIRADRFGEFLLIIPALRALKTTFKGARITAIVGPAAADIARRVPYIDDVIIKECPRFTLPVILQWARRLKNLRCDAAVIFHPSREFNQAAFLAGIPVRAGYNRKWGFLLTHRIADLKYLGRKHEIDYNLELAAALGARTDDASLLLDLAGASMPASIQAALTNDTSACVAVHPFTSDPHKQWPFANFDELERRLRDELRIRVVLVGRNSQYDKSGCWIDLVNTTSLSELACVLRNCEALISCDSGPVHLASCVGTPTVAIFRNDIPGKSSRRWGPRAPGSVVVENERLENISVDDVFAALKNILKDEKVPSDRSIRDRGCAVHYPGPAGSENSVS